MSGQRIAGVVLAAGSASRYGRPKQIETLAGGKTLVAAVVETALTAGLWPVILVVGCHADAVAAAVAGLPVTVVANAEWATGQGSSVRAGVAALPADAPAAVFLLADQPFVQPATVRSLADAYASGDADIVAPTVGGRRGNPVLFGRRTFAALSRLAGDEGGRAVIRSGEFVLHELPVDDAGILVDVDRPADLLRNCHSEVERSEAEESLCPRKTKT